MLLALIYREFRESGEVGGQESLSKRGNKSGLDTFTVLIRDASFPVVKRPRGSGPTQPGESKPVGALPSPALG